MPLINTTRRRRRASGRRQRRTDALDECGVQRGVSDAVRRRTSTRLADSTSASAVSTKPTPRCRGYRTGGHGLALCQKMRSDATRRGLLDRPRPRSYVDAARSKWCRRRRTVRVAAAAPSRRGGRAAGPTQPTTRTTTGRRGRGGRAARSLACFLYRAGNCVRLSSGSTLGGLPTARGPRTGTSISRPLDFRQFPMEMEISGNFRKFPGPTLGFLEIGLLYVGDAASKGKKLSLGPLKHERPVPFSCFFL